MSSRCSRGRQVVGLQNVLILRLALVELVVLPSDRGDLEHIAQHLSSCGKENEDLSEVWILIPSMNKRGIELKIKDW